MARFRLMKGAKKAKFNNQKVTTPDGVFDSKRELKRWEQLKLLEASGVIFMLKRQVKFSFDSVVLPNLTDSPAWVELGGGGRLFKRKVSYTADFVYEEGGSLVVEDCKGFRTDAYKRKRQWMKKVYGITILET